MNLKNEDILKILKSHGYEAKILPVEHISDLKDEITGLHKKGLLDETFYKRYLSNFKFDYSAELPDAKSIVVIAIPQPMTILNFSWKGKTYKGIIPPSYIYDETDEQVTEILKGLLYINNYNFVRASVPLKLLSARSGLSMYGRNNITYIPGMGSFYRMAAFITNINCEKDSYQKAKVMESCKNCNICIKNCPTNSLNSERFLIHAENCLTYLNENKDDFPDWIGSNLHNSVVGCMRCQIICPENKNYFKSNEVSNIFSEDEISLILNKTELKNLPQKTIQSLKKFGLIDYYSDNILSRNLKALINK